MTSVHVRGMAIDSEGEGPPIVMLHGLGGTSNSFQAMMPALCRLSRGASGSARAPAARRRRRKRLPSRRWWKRSRTPPSISASVAHMWSAIPSEL